MIGNQDCNRTEGTSFIGMEPHFECNPDCFDYERNAMSDICRISKVSLICSSDKVLKVVFAGGYISEVTKSHPRGDNDKEFSMG